MEFHQDGELTALIQEARTGGKVARDKLFQAIYGEFHRIAVSLMGKEIPGHELQPTALVGEAVIRLLNGGAVEKAPNRHYLFGAATRAMRQTLIDYHRRRQAREGKLKKLPLDEILAYVERQNLNIEALNEALDRLSEINERQGLVVVLRFLAGLTTNEVAEALDVSVGTVENDWRFARAWLRDQLSKE